jgi:glycosyltransferase involved in cell wall biosynthesis
MNRILNKENFPLISIITVVYNAVNDIESTIQSVVGQTYKRIEYIVIDGGSVDGTKDVIERHKHNISFFKSESDNGIYEAMNKGITIATGEWILFMNAGDTFNSNTIIQECYDDKLFNVDNDVIYGDRILFDPVYGKKIVQVAEINKLNFGMHLFHQSCFVKLSLQKKYLYDETYRISGDFDFFYKLYKEKYLFKKTNIKICVFALGGVSADDLKQLYESKRVILKNNTNLFFKLFYTFPVNFHICKIHVKRILIKTKNSRMLVWNKK